MRALAFAVLIGATLATAGSAASDTVTTRIETRPFYGAVVTLEEGVRVFRPLPRHDRIIINPGGQTPLSLSFAESHNYSFNQYSGNGGAYVPYYMPDDYGGYGNIIPHRRHHGRGGRGGRSHGVGGGGKR